MASEVDIANLGLAHLGDEATVSSFDPPEGSAQAEHCARFYPIARDACLEAHAWTFAKRTVQLTGGTTAVDGWGYAYILPSDCLRPLRIYPEGGRRELETSYEYEVETDASGQAILLTDLEEPYVVYLRPVEDTTKFTPGFVTALSYLLASMLAGPVVKGETGQAMSKYWLQVYRAYIGAAAAIDANSQRQRFDQIPSAIEARA